MNFIPIFTKSNTCDLWSVCYPEDEIDGLQKDVYSILMDERWTDMKYLIDFIKIEKMSMGFDNQFWEGFSISDMVEKIQIEIASIDNELYQADLMKDETYFRSLDKIFIKLHQNIYSLNTFNDSHRKARPNFKNSIIRFYGIELNDGTIIITGGTLKLKLKMVGLNFDQEIINLKRVQAFLKSQGITDRLGLID
jgi:hypothetical protein